MKLTDVSGVEEPADKINISALRRMHRTRIAARCQSSGRLLRPQSPAQEWTAPAQIVKIGREVPNAIHHTDSFLTVVVRTGRGQDQDWRAQTTADVENVG